MWQKTSRGITGCERQGARAQPRGMNNVSLNIHVCVYFYKCSRLDTYCLNCSICQKRNTNNSLSSSTQTHLHTYIRYVTQTEVFQRTSTVTQLVSFLKFSLFQIPLAGVHVRYLVCSWEHLSTLQLKWEVTEAEANCAFNLGNPCSVSRKMVMVKPKDIIRPGD